MRRNADWTYFLNFSDLDRACKVFNDIVKTVAEKHAPYVTHKIKGKAEAWVTHDFLQSIKEGFSDEKGKQKQIHHRLG